MKFVLSLLIGIFLIAFISAPSSTLITSSTTAISFDKYTITPSFNGVSSIDDKVYDIKITDKAFYIEAKDNKTIINLKNFYWKMDFNPDAVIDPTCTGNQYITTCTGSKFDDSTFMAKNVIKSREVMIVDDKGTWWNILNWFDNILKLDKIPDVTYVINYTGTITNLDPALIETVSTSTTGFYNQTEATNLGVRDNAPILFMDFNTPSEAPLGTYNNSVGTYIEDGSVYNNFAIVTGNKNNDWWTFGNFSNGLQFDGTNDFMRYTLANPFTINFTRCAWAKGYGTIFGEHADFATHGSSSFEISSTGNFTIKHQDTSSLFFYQATNTVLNVSTWHQYCETFVRNQSVKFYIDGVLNKTSTLGYYGLSWGSNNLFVISGHNYGTGAQTAPAGGLFNGIIDEAMIFNRSLSAEEINSLYLNQSANIDDPLISDSTLLAYWRFNETGLVNSTKAVDSTGKYNGTLTNFDSSTPSYNATGGYGGSGAYTFDGINDIITLAPITGTGGSAVGGKSQRTVSFWIYPRGFVSAAGYQTPWFESIAASGSTRLNIAIDNSGAVSMSGRFADADSITAFALAGANPLTLNTWNYVTAVFDGVSGQHQIYINAINRTTTRTAKYGNFGTGAKYVWIGSDGTARLNATLDQLQVWDRVLSQDEILNLYNGTTNNSNYIGKYNLAGNFKSGVFYNSSVSYWNTTLSIADTYSTSSGIVNNKNEINLSNPNLVSYWNFDGNFADAKGRNNGTAIKGVNNATGVSSSAMRFDGVDDYVKIISSSFANFSLYGNFSFSIWFKANSGSGNIHLFSKILGASPYTGYQSYINSSGSVLWQLYDGDAGIDAISRGTLTNYRDNNWHHALFRYNGTGNSGGLAIFMDGNLANTINYSLNTFNANTEMFNNNNLTIGSFSEGSSSFFNGSIDEVLIYNTSLSAAQVTQLYKSGLSQHANTNVTIQTRTANTYNTTDPSLLGLWTFNNDNTTTVLDEKGVRNGRYDLGALSNYTSGFIDKGAYFDGSNDYINISTNLGLNGRTAVTFGAWVYARSDGGGAIRTLLAKHTVDSDNTYQTFNLALTASNQVQCSVQNYRASFAYPTWTTTAVYYNTWHSYYCSYNKTFANGSDMVVYVDGVATPTTYTANAYGAGFVLNETATEPVTIGRRWLGSWSQTHYGNIDEVRIYNRSISASEAQSLYELGSSHITDWTPWTSESLVRDSIGQISSSSGKFMQFKSYLYSNDTSVSPYVLGHNVTILTDIAPDVVFNSKSPADIVGFNIATSYLNITYNISDINGNLDNSTIRLYYKTNNSNSNYVYYNNGSAQQGYFPAFYNSSYTIDGNYIWNLEEVNVYPGTYNIGEISTMRFAQHSVQTLTNNNQYKKLEFLNLTNVSNFFFEVMANASGTGALRAYYCNSSYTTGNPATDNYCVQLGSLAATTTFNHAHSAQSKHNVISTIINQSTGQLKGITVSPTSYILLRGVTGTTWNIYSIANTSRLNAMQSSANTGTSYTSETYTIDSHIHQFSNNDTFYYYACANDTVGNSACSSVRSDILTSGSMPPTGLIFYSPQNASYEKSMDFNITYLYPESPNGYPIASINISLLNLDLSYNRSIVQNNVGNSNYSWNTLSTPQSSYIISVAYCDNNSQCSTAYSSQFALLNDITLPVLTVYTPQNITYYSSRVSLSVSATDNVDISNYWYSLDGGINTTFTPNSSVANLGFEDWHNILIYVNDTSNNIVKEMRRFYVGSTPFNETDPIWNATIPVSCPSGYIVNGTYANGTLSCTAGGSSTSSITICRYKKLGYYNDKLPWLKEDNCV